MKIAFWSNSGEQSGVSLGIAAIAVASVIRYPYTIAILENHLRKNNLGWAFLGTNKPAERPEIGTNYYEGGGMEGLLRKIYRGSRDPAILRPFLKAVIPKHLYYLPQSGFIGSGLFDYEFNLNSDILFDMLEETVDICYIDTAPFNNLSSKTILEEADLIVVNLCQNHKSLEDFFMNYSSLIPKSIFIIGNYEINTAFSCRRIARHYKLPVEIIIPIPKNEMFEAACLRGRAVEFIMSNYMCRCDNPNYHFIQSVRRAAGMIMKKAGIPGERAGKELGRCRA